MLAGFWAWYRHARSFGKPIVASLVYARAKTSNKQGPTSLATSRALTREVTSDHAEY